MKRLRPAVIYMPGRNNYYHNLLQSQNYLAPSVFRIGFYSFFLGLKEEVVNIPWHSF